MSTSTHPTIILFDSDAEDAFSSTDYTLASSDYSPASPGNTFFDSKTKSDPSEDLSKDRSAPLAITPFPDDPYLHIRRAYYATIEESSYLLSSSTIPPPPALIEYGIEDLVDGRREQIKHDDEIVLTHVGISTLEILIEDIQVTMALLPPGFLEPLYPDIMAMIIAQDIEHIIPPIPPRDTDPPIGSPIPSSTSSLVGSSSPVRSTTPPPDYPFDESIFVELDNSLWITPRPLGSELIPKEPNEMALKRKLTSAAPAMTQAAIKKLVADSVAAALEAQAATMANADNTNRNNREGETTVARKCSYKEFMSCQPSYFKGTKGAVGLIRWFKRTESVAYKTTWSELNKLLTKKYCPRTEVKKMEDEFYSLTVKWNDLKTYVRRFQELAVLYPTMVPNSEKLMEVFIEGLPRSIEGNVTALLIPVNRSLTP
ncbi:reverse transcriptase domain-containing protein [Tanacetum coccineum]